MSYKVLVVSDSHRRDQNLKKAIANMGDYMDMMIHLGDSETEEQLIRRLTDKPVEMVRGNCDGLSGLPIASILTIKHHKVFITHGHRYGGARDMGVLKEMAKENGCDVLMFGHTHIPYLEETEDVVLFCPGSISQPRQQNRQPSYGVMTIEDDGRTQFAHVYLS